MKWEGQRSNMQRLTVRYTLKHSAKRRISLLYADFDNAYGLSGSGTIPKERDKIYDNTAL